MPTDPTLHCSSVDSERDRERDLRTRIVHESDRIHPWRKRHPIRIIARIVELGHIRGCNERLLHLNRIRIRLRTDAKPYRDIDRYGTSALGNRNVDWSA